MRNQPLTKVNYYENQTTDGHRWTQMNCLLASAVIIYNLQFLTRTELAQAKR
jgi:hypothetical protein